MERARAETRRYEDSLAKANVAALRLQKSLDDEVKASLQRTHTAMDNTGKAFLLGGAAIAAGLALSVNEAIKWEYAWKGVTKTTNGSAAQMADLENQLRGLTKILPASHEEIAAVAEAAGQLGVARQDIAKFTETAINLGQATNLSAEEAATSIAQFLNVMGAGADQADHVGNTLVALGNKGASTESQIMEMASRLSGAGKLIGASSSDVLGLAASMANLGIQSQLGGGAMQRTLTIIYAKMKEGGPAAAQFAQVAGMSAQKFAAEWEKDPVRAVDAFVQGLGRIKAQGGNVVGTLADLGLKGTQNLNVLLRLAGAGDMLTKSIDQSSQAWEANSALVNEVEKRYQTTQAQIELARNQLVDSAIDIGNTFLPAIAAVVSTGRDLAAFWGDLPGPLKTATAVLALLAAAVALTGGAALVAVPKIAAFKVAVAELESGALKTAGTRLQGVAGFLAGPWGAAIGIGITALGLFAAKHEEAKRKIDELSSTLDAQTGAITDNTRQWVINELSKSGALDQARELGISVGLVTEAALGNADALAKVNDQLGQFTVKQSEGGQGARGAAGYMQSQVPVALRLREALNGTNGALDSAIEKQKLKAAADRESSGSTKDATHNQKGATQAWRDGADAAGDLSQQVKTLGDELHDASADYLDNRDASRQVRDALRGIREAMHQYVHDHGSLSGAFKDGTKSGDDFAGLLDRLAQDYQTHISTVEKVTGSEKAVQKAYNESRDRLIAVAQQLGMTKKEAENYVTQVLQVPPVVTTHFEQPGLDDGLTGVGRLKAALDGIERVVNVHINVTRHTNALLADVNTPKHHKSDDPKTGHSGGGRGGSPSRRWFHSPKTSSRLPGGTTSSRSPVGSSGPTELSVSGVLDTPWGPAEVHGIATGAAHRVYTERSEADHDYEGAHG